MSVSRRWSTIIKATNIAMLGLALIVSLQFLPAFTVGMLTGLFFMGFGNALAWFGRSDALLLSGTGITIAGLFFFINSGGFASIPLAVIVIVLLIPVALIALVAK